MKLIQLFLLFIVIETYGQTNNYTDSMGLKQGEWTIDLPDSSGKIKNPISVCTFLNDTLNGPFIVYDGEKIAFENNYLMGVKDGEERSFDKNMCLKELKLYSKGELIYQIQFYPKGIVNAEFSYRNGMLNGVIRKYFKNGRLWISEDYKDGKLNGEKRHFNRRGDIISIFDYKNGVLVNVSKY